MNLGLNLRFGHKIKVCMMSHETYISLTWNFSVSRNVFSIISYVICVVLQIVFMFVTFKLPTTIRSDFITCIIGKYVL